MSLRRPEAPQRKLSCDRQNAIWDLTINNQSINALQNQFSRVLFQQDGADRAILEHDHTAPNDGAFKILGAAGREDVVIDYQTGAITIGAAGTLTLNLPIVSNPDDFQVGTLDALSNPQIWYKAANATFRLGSATSQGDASDVAAGSIQVVGENIAGDPMDVDNYSLFFASSQQIVLRDEDAGTLVNLLIANNTRLTYRNVASTGNIFEVFSNQVRVGTGNGAEVMTVVLRNYANLDFANDAAAAAGGVPLGGIYHTLGAARVRIV